MESMRGGLETTDSRQMHNKEILLSRFGSDPLAFFSSVYEETPPWDIGAAQPAMSALLAKYPPTDPILDVGCGSGDLSIYLAKLGHQVLGIDFVETAIINAQNKLGPLPTEVAHQLNFQVADALRPSLLQQQFGAVVDSGFFHLFDSSQCDRFIDELAITLLPYGQYYLHKFAI
jgi:cyclopropane fatty-acyl-phospholipid synthase-like methyltransferase